MSIHLGLDSDERAGAAGIILAAAGIAVGPVGGPVAPACGRAGGRPVGAPVAGPMVLAGDLNEGPGGRAWSAIAARLQGGVE